MKNTLKLLAAGTTLALASVSAHAADNFVGLTWGETSNNIQRSGSLKQNLPDQNFDRVIDNSSTWGVRAGQQTDTGRYYATYENQSGSSGPFKLRQQNLLGSYDAFVPIAERTNLFVGGTLGLIKLEQESTGFSRDSDIGYAAGLQAGLLHQVANTNASVEGGYRYLRSNASTKLTPRGDSNLGSLDLKSSEQFYIGVNYNF
jgi:hypothetical protein|tara:strand:+ start:15273 stop:15878 length:606 start_codon:yes stop_codon:yes gene_type:complete